MDEHPTTCGQGLAANARLPAAIGELLSAMAEVLEDHRQALDPGDPAARPEDEAYEKVVRELRAISAHAASVARTLTGYRDLPMGRHDDARMAAPDAQAALVRFVDAERHLLQWLTASVPAHEEMLREWGPG